MKVLVTAASKHGSTHEIGEAIAMQIQALGIPAEFCDLDSPMRHIEASAVVLGSPIYMGRWLPEASDFAEKHRDQLKNRGHSSSFLVSDWLTGIGLVSSGSQRVLRRTPQP